MLGYRIYMTDAEGHVRSGQDFTSHTDEQACLRARSLVGRYSRVEVWVGTRLVCVESPSPEVAAGD